MKFEKLGPVGLEEFWSAGAQLPLLRMKVLQQKLELSSLEFGFEQLFLVLRRPFSFVRNDARGRRRNSGLPRRSPHFGTLVQKFLPFFHLVIPPRF